MKRAFDILASAIAILVLSPLLLPVMLALRFSGEGEVFYRQQRIGRGGKPFSILKFATMLKDSPNMPGGDITTGKDPRILPMGKFLRDTKINELPQLFNVVRGEMSLIGPRPLTPRVSAMFPPEHWKAVNDMRPGLSGAGSILFRNEEALLANSADRMSDYARLVVPYKSQLEKWYAKNSGLLTDLALIAITLAVIVRPQLDVHALLKDLPRPPADLAVEMAKVAKQQSNAREMKA